MNARFGIIVTAALALAPSIARASGVTGRGTDPTARPDTPPATALGDGSESMPCALVTRAEAARALGAAGPAGTEKQLDLPLAGGARVRAQYCFYGSDVMIGRYALGSSGGATFGRHRRALAAEPGFRAVTGVGDEAFAARGQLNVRRGNTGIVIDVGQPRSPALSEAAAERSLAAMAVARM
jgi:hypothetical protein